VESKCYDGDVAVVSTFEFHKDRERAPHWEQPIHRGRLETAGRFVLAARDIDAVAKTTVVDLGCGDGGLVAHLRLNWSRTLDVSGYDFQPSNEDGWKERRLEGVCHQLDFVRWWTAVPRAEVYVITEVLEHLTDPHAMLKRIRLRGAQLVCSSPHDETYESHDACHAWAWDQEGYAAMIREAGFAIRAHEIVDRFQVVWAVPE